MTAAFLDGVAPLPDWGVIRAQGPDAASFLHGQLTQDFSLLDTGHARLAALCSPKGRMLASFIGIKPQPELVLLACSADLLAATLKRLSIYVLRAKLKLDDASAQYALYGLAGAALAQNGLDPAAAPFTCRARDAAWAVTLHPADGVPRALWIAPADSPPPEGEPLNTTHWHWGEIRSGVATVSAPVVDAFVPQMLNYESVDGINFKKGCYPGQEVVARSQYRGTVKRRAYLISADGPLQAGDEVFAAGDAEQPVGTVAQAAPGPDGRWSALVSVQIEALNAGGLRAGSARGVALTVEPLPYPLLQEI